MFRRITLISNQVLERSIMQNVTQLLRERREGPSAAPTDLGGKKKTLSIMLASPTDTFFHASFPRFKTTIIENPLQLPSTLSLPYLGDN